MKVEYNLHIHSFSQSKAARCDRRHSVADHGAIEQDFGAIRHNSSRDFGFNGRTEHLA